MIPGVGSNIKSGPRSKDVRAGAFFGPGFSLIEIVITIAIPSIMAGMMVPMSVHLIDQRNVESSKKGDGGNQGRPPPLL